MSRRATTVADFSGAWARTLPAGLSLVVADEIGSTQQLSRRLLARHAEEGERPGPFAVLALAQSAGHGRRARGWSSGHGLGVWSTLVLPVAAERLQEAPMRAAVALASALREASGVDCRLKWPNDLVIAGSKVGGLLVDVTSRGEREAWLAIGFGVNHGHGADALPTPAATSLALRLPPGRPLPPLEEVAARLLTALWHELTGDGDGWLERYRELSAHRPGDPLVCELPDGVVEGRFAGFEEHGFLRLATDAGERVIRSGEVYSW
ncbi:MAG: biotin--[acetyl-CoA-carboxylase] ligase [Thermoanaerobaculia bacterium]|jgi:BirA family biotin operon repressor/biotin-[acetyl-CoA-carboxylase] ligase|nr:MAG: biotin--[acetyl-CoA-carboxylase] ligase [Thermoanaerobaculia bacterium]MBZ0102474.1 biotin--[acetyl-CoA-carboxylase] ligase [Thermoanaerobaculia bacterium]